jgi:hypothetical protein
VRFTPILKEGNQHEKRDVLPRNGRLPRSYLPKAGAGIKRRSSKIEYEDEEKQ